MTLRKLAVMAEAKQEHDFDVAIMHAGLIGRLLTGDRERGELNPVRAARAERLTKSKPTPDIEQDNHVIGWSMLHTFLKQQAGNHGT